MWRDAALAGAVLVNLGFFGIALSNILYLRRATKKPRLKAGPFVSVIVPARDEERNVGPCVASLLAQDYADYELIVVDDRSTDDTAAIVESYASDRRLRLV